METINIHQAKTHLSRLVDEAVNGEPFIIAKAGRPLVKVVALETPEHSQQKKIGFLSNAVTIPDDFDNFKQTEIEQLFKTKL